jgi:hypothetical protein
MGRGNETTDHLNGKSALAVLWEQRGHQCLFEEGLSDVVAIRVAGGKKRIICNEYERSTRNLARNVWRDFFRGCDALLILVPDEKLQAAARRKLNRDFPRSIWTKVSIVTASTVKRLLTKSGRSQEPIRKGEI